MRGRRIWGITLLYVGALTLLLGAAATFLPASPNRQIQMILGSFSVPSKSPVLNAFNNMMLALMTNCWAVLCIGALCVGAGILCLFLSGRIRTTESFAACKPEKDSVPVRNDVYVSPAQTVVACKPSARSMRTANCPVCGALNDGGAVRCRRCGVNLLGENVLGISKQPDTISPIRQDASLYAPPPKADAVLRKSILPAELPVPFQGPAWDGESYPDSTQIADTAVSHRLVDTPGTDKTTLAVPSPAALSQHTSVPAEESEYVAPHKISPRIVTTIHPK